MYSDNFVNMFFYKFCFFLFCNKKTGILRGACLESENRMVFTALTAERGISAGMIWEIMSAAISEKCKRL